MTKIPMAARNHPRGTDTEMHAVRARLLAPTAARSLAGVFKSLSDPTRLRIVSLLAEGEFCVTDLATALEMEQSTISHQLRDMRAQRLVSFRREGQHVYYRLDDPHVRSLFEQGVAHIQD
jgi:ArsR family transcriptional regulator, lead/cadmium/zinc/bismuth-responsive transcriptional repressor